MTENKYDLLELYDNYVNMRLKKKNLANYRTSIYHHSYCVYDNKNSLIYSIELEYLYDNLKADIDCEKRLININILGWSRKKAA